MQHECYGECGICGELIWDEDDYTYYSGGMCHTECLEGMINNEQDD